MFQSIVCHMQTILKQLYAESLKVLSLSDIQLPHHNSRVTSCNHHDSRVTPCDLDSLVRPCDHLSCADSTERIVGEPLSVVIRKLEQLLSVTNHNRVGGASEEEEVLYIILLS